jgi:hypothetical protein
MDGWIDRVGGRKTTTTTRSEDRGGLEVQVNDKNVGATEGGVVYALLILWKRTRKKNNNNNNKRRRPPSPHLSLGIFPTILRCPPFCIHLLLISKNAIPCKAMLILIVVVMTGEKLPIFPDRES